MKRGAISNLLRKLRLIYITDWIQFYWQRFKNRKVNTAFKKAHPNVAIPPDYLLYESFQIHYPKYYIKSQEAAKNLVAHFTKHIPLNNKKVLDWGCGPARILRHLPELMDQGCSFYGTDYNTKTINWCSENLPNIQFNNNTLSASLPYDDNYFDIIYGLSIFTHLSAAMHTNWFNELYRILKPGGIMLITTQGTIYKDKLTAKERLDFDAGKLVVRGQVKEGHRTYSAFQPKPFMLDLVKQTEILEHIEQPVQGKWYPQDIWILRKN